MKIFLIAMPPGLLERLKAWREKRARAKELRGAELEALEWERLFKERERLEREAKLLGRKAELAELRKQVWEARQKLESAHPGRGIRKSIAGAQRWLGEMGERVDLDEIIYGERKYPPAPPRKIRRGWVPPAGREIVPTVELPEFDIDEILYGKRRPIRRR